MVTMRWHSPASSGLWVMSTMVFPCSRCSRWNRSITRRPVAESSAPVGSSASKDGGVVGHGARNGHALLLPAGKLAGRMARAVAHFHHIQQRAGALGARSAAHAVVHHGQRHVLQRAGAGHQVERLEYKSDLPAADAGELLVAQCAYVHAVQHIGAFRGAVQRADDVHQRGFARTGRAHDGHKFAFAHRQVNAVQHLQFLARADGEPLDDAVHVDDGSIHITSLPGRRWACRRHRAYRRPACRRPCPC